MESNTGHSISLLAVQLSLLLLCGCCYELAYSHSEQSPDDADYGFSETSSTHNKPGINGRPVVLHGSHGYIGVGAVSDKVTTSPNNYWRIVCNSSDFEIFVVLMGMHLAPHSYLQVKTTKYEGCTEKFHGRHFHKKSILIGFLSDSAILSAFRMAYVCVGTDKQNLASEALENRAVLDYVAENEEKLDVFLQFLNNPGMILTHIKQLQPILDLSQQSPMTSDDENSGDGNVNLTEQDLE